MLETERLQIIPSTVKHLKLIVAENWPALCAELGGISMAENWYHFPEAFRWMYDYLGDHPREFTWWNYLVVHRGEHRLIGSAGYKGPPSLDGVIEIGYEIADAYQNQGYATETARALLQRAFVFPKVRIVQAHTLPEKNASGAVLQKLGMRFVKTVDDPDDGPIWLWEITREAHMIRK